MDTTSPPGPVDVNDAAEAVVTALGTWPLRSRPEECTARRTSPTPWPPWPSPPASCPGSWRAWSGGSAPRPRPTGSRCCRPTPQPRGARRGGRRAGGGGQGRRADAGMAQIALETGRGAVAGLARRTEQSVGA
ncbi:hypothetical protein ACFQXA_38865 [Nocardiopsis composta]